MAEIDLNADIGEGAPYDEALLGLVSSANIACGWHAGGPGPMRDCVRWARARGVAIGAHPSFHDPKNFGRVEMVVAPHDVYAGVLYQVGALAAIAGAEGTRLAHVKPHGALYNQAARDPAMADAIAGAVRAFDPSIALFGLAGSELISAARRAGLAAVEEVFADRAYRADGSLVPRSCPGALIESDDEVVARTLTMVREQRVRTIDDGWAPLRAQTVCLHGDGVQALGLATHLRAALSAAGIAVRATMPAQLGRTD
jgi:UPF0271 protein